MVYARRPKLAKRFDPVEAPTALFRAASLPFCGVMIPTSLAAHGCSTANVWLLNDEAGGRGECGGWRPELQHLA